MNTVYGVASNVCSPLGLSTEEVWTSMQQGQSGIKTIFDPALLDRPIPLSRFNQEQWEVIAHRNDQPSLSRMEQLALFSAKEAIQNCARPLDLSTTLMVLSTTKGNIDGLGHGNDPRNRLSNSAALIAASLGIPGRSVVISHACISGLSSLMYGMRRLQLGDYRTVIIVGVDILSRFVISGFASFMALSSAPCRPFDLHRDGINLGEAAATMILSLDPGKTPLAILSGAATSNDANHISGPSRTGAELALAIGRSIQEAGITSADIMAISAHGTATLYNDEMEAKAFALAQILHAPLHSLKGYFGHTLGAAGVLESVLLVESIRRGRMIPSAGFETLGVSEAVSISQQAENCAIKHALKTASGFGGCNAALVWSRI